MRWLSSKIFGSDVGFGNAVVAKASYLEKNRCRVPGLQRPGLAGFFAVRECPTGLAREDSSEAAKGGRLARHGQHD